MTHHKVWIFGVCGLVLAMLSGCASGPTPLAKLREARMVLDQARSAETPAAVESIEEAEGALMYAEGEYRISPEHPLSMRRAENALEKARTALRLTGASQAPRAAH